MSTIVIELPHDVSDSLRIPNSEKKYRILQELAIRLYEKDLLTFGKARELAGLDKWGFYDLLAREQVIRQYDLEELHEDLKTIEFLA